MNISLRSTQIPSLPRFTIVPSLLIVSVLACSVSPYARAQGDENLADEIERQRMLEEQELEEQREFERLNAQQNAESAEASNSDSTGENDSTKKDGDASAKKANPGGPVKRTNEPPEPPDRRELEARPDQTGMVQFNFRNQPWPDLMRWLAEISGMSLDWQELPGDYLNIATQDKMTITDARDMFNRHLLTRGYTMLEFDGILQVEKTAEINPSLVPKVFPQQLNELQPNQFVRVTFPLNALVVDDVIEEFKTLLSKNGKLIPLSATNRMEAMDAVINLRDIARILNDEQSDAALENLAREFKLKYIRAEVAKDSIDVFLGKRRNVRSTGNVNSMMMQQMQEMQQQMMAQMQQMGQQNSGGGRKRNSQFYMIANSRQNSLIVHAAPDRMALVASFIQRIDVPSERAQDVTSLKFRMKVYRLASLDPEKLVRTLQNRDLLEPQTTLEIDTDNKSIIAYASIADQYVIQQVIDQLDGSAREFYVMQLRRLDAEQVAGTIKFLMGGDEDEEDDNNYGYYSYYNYNRNDKKDDTDEFRVGANAQDNQLLIRANEVEKEEIEKLLVKLGEIPEEGNQNPYRVIDATRSPETFEYLKRLQREWGTISSIELELPDEGAFAPKKRQPEQLSEPGLGDETRYDFKTREPAGAGRSEAVPPGVFSSVLTDKTTANKDDSNGKATKSSQTSSKNEASDSEAQSSKNEPMVDVGKAKGSTTKGSMTKNGQQESATEPQVGFTAVDDQSVPPVFNPNGRRRTRPQSTVADSIDRNSPNFGRPKIKISVNRNGDLVLYSEDKEALNRLEELMSDMTPPRRDYAIFKVKYARASWVTLNLKDFFRDQTKSTNRFGFRFRRREEKEESPKLGDKPKLKFVSDNDTRSIIVTGADDPTLETIEELIRLWDVPEEENDEDVRYTRLVKIKYSKADAIVATVKDAYRDLLSSNDKAFQNENGNGGGGGGSAKEAKRTSSSSVTNGGMSFRFSGRLSLGVDAITNSVVVSAQGNDLLNLICEMIEELDAAAKPSGAVEVIQLDGGANSRSLEKALKAMLRGRSAGGQQQQQQRDDNG